MKKSFFYLADKPLKNQPSPDRVDQLLLKMIICRRRKLTQILIRSSMDKEFSPYLICKINPCQNGAADITPPVDNPYCFLYE